MIEEYKTIEKMNQSLLKKILISPYAFVKEKERYELDDDEEIEKAHFIFGSLVDVLLLDPNTFDKRYYVMPEGNAVSDEMKKILHYVYDLTSISGDIIPITLEEDTVMDRFILEAVNHTGWQPRYKDETKIAKVKEAGKGYFNALIESADRTIVTAEDKAKATICVASLKADEYIGKYLTPSATNTIYRRKVIQFDYKGIDFKSELDEIYIDHADKTIQPIDYKTEGQSINMFKYNFWKFRYDFQASVYSFGVRQDPEMQQLIRDGYTVLPFIYIVVESNSINKPMVFNITAAVDVIGFNGGVLSPESGLAGKKLEGFLQAITRYKFHSENDQWDYPMEYYQNKGSIDIKI